MVGSAAARCLGVTCQAFCTHLVPRPGSGRSRCLAKRPACSACQELPAEYGNDECVLIGSAGGCKLPNSSNQRLTSLISTSLCQTSSGQSSAAFRRWGACCRTQSGKRGSVSFSASLMSALQLLQGLLRGEHLLQVWLCRHLHAAQAVGRFPKKPRTWSSVRINPSKTVALSMTTMWRQILQRAVAVSKLCCCRQHLISAGKAQCGRSTATPLIRALATNHNCFLSSDGLLPTSWPQGVWSTALVLCWCCCSSCCVCWMEPNCCHTQ
jgi:hypothetical protein